VQAISERLQRFVAEQLARHAGPLAAMGEAAGDLFTPPRVRALLAALTDNSGTIGRAVVEDQLNALTPEERPQLRKLGFTIGSLDIFHPLLLKPEAVRWRAALTAAQQGAPVPALPPHGAVLQKAGTHAGLVIAGFRRCASGWLRIDMAEKLARQAHAARMQASAPPTASITGRGAHDDDHAGTDDEHDGVAAAPPPGFVIDPALATSLGLDEETRRALLGSFGFRSVGEPALQRWRWSGLRKPEKRTRRKPHPNRKGADVPARAAANGETRRAPAHQAKGQRGKPEKPRVDAPRPPRADRPDRPPRRGPSPNSPFAGLAALLADARKD
jgi:ATP-dependent RNA helicase SUPV3L1/SUV3